MSAWYTGAITITPPLGWAEIRNGPRLRNVRLRIAESAVDTDACRTTTATADAILPLEDGALVAGDVAEDIQAIVDHYSPLGHEFTGHIQCDYPTGLVGPGDPNRERYVVRDGRVQTVTPQLVWPGESPTLEQLTAEQGVGVYDPEDQPVADLRTRIAAALNGALATRARAFNASGIATQSAYLADAVLAAIDDEAVERMAQHYVDDTHLQAVEFRNGMEMKLKPARDMVALWVAAAKTMLGEAENYSETEVRLPSMSMDVKVAEEFEMFTLTVQRARKPTPHDLRRLAELQAAELRDLLGSIWLYVSWPYVTKQLTTKQKELWADAVDAWNAALEGGETVRPVAERWWRDA